jgi:hypothetical protein
MSSSLPPLLPHATRDLAHFAAKTRYADIPATVIARVKLSILDGLGVCLHGATLPWTQKVRDVVLADGGNPLASVWNSGAKVGLTGAVLVNSTAGHAFEMDDIHKESILHPNSLSVPTPWRSPKPIRRSPGRTLSRRSRWAPRSARASAMPRPWRCS